MTLPRLVPVFLFTLSLTACLPETEISQKVITDVLSVNTTIKRVAELTAKSFKNTQINNPTLQPYLTRGTATTITGTCAEEKGSYLFSKSDDSQQFSLVLDQCKIRDGGTIDGTMNGSFTVNNGLYSMSIAGNLNTMKDNVSIALSPMDLGFEFDLDKTSSLFLTQDGTYTYQSDQYKGAVAVSTDEAVGIDDITLEARGKVTYTDESGNHLTVKHTNNGVNIYLNGTYFNTYSHSEWQGLFG
jgi:hypothetical protein